MDVLELIKKEGLRRKLSTRTIETYCYCVKKFFQENDKEPRTINRKDIKDYLDILAKKDVSGSTLNVNLNALKFLMQEILNKNFFVKIKFSKHQKLFQLF